MGSLGGPWLANAIGIISHQEALKDISSGTPLPVGHIVALGGRLAVLARRANIIVTGHTALSLHGGSALGQGTGTLGAQGIDGRILQVLGDTKGKTGSAKAPGNYKKKDNKLIKYLSTQ